MAARPRSPSSPPSRPRAAGTTRRSCTSTWSSGPSPRRTSPRSSSPARSCRRTAGRSPSSRASPATARPGRAACRSAPGWRAARSRRADITTGFEVSWLCWKDADTLVFHAWAGAAVRRAGCSRWTAPPRRCAPARRPSAAGARPRSPSTPRARCSPPCASRPTSRPRWRCCVSADAGAAGSEVTAFNAALQEPCPAALGGAAAGRPPDGTDVHGPGGPAAGQAAGRPAADGDRARRPGRGLDAPVDELRPPAALDGGGLRGPHAEPARQPGLGAGVRARPSSATWAAASWATSCPASTRSSATGSPTPAGSASSAPATAAS